MSKVQGDTTFVANSEKVVVEVQYNEEWVWENGLRVRKARVALDDKLAGAARAAGSKFSAHD